MRGDSLPKVAAIMFALALGGLAPASEAADPSAGKSVFSSTCSICHSVQPGKNMVGPSLFGLVGRKTGSVPGFHYSPANQNANLTWDGATLDKYPAIPARRDPRNDNDLWGTEGRCEALRPDRLPRDGQVMQAGHT